MSNPWGLTPRECEVVELVVEGLVNTAIAARLFMEPRTVNAHMNHIISKMVQGNEQPRVMVVLKWLAWKGEGGFCPSCQNKINSPEESRKREFSTY